MNCYSDVQSELANYKRTSQLYAQLEHSDIGSSTLRSRKDDEEPVNIRPMNSVVMWSECHKCSVQEQSYLLYLGSL